MAASLINVQKIIMNKQRKVCFSPLNESRTYCHHILYRVLTIYVFYTVLTLLWCSECAYTLITLLYLLNAGIIVPERHELHTEEQQPSPGRVIPSDELQCDDGVYLTQGYSNGHILDRLVWLRAAESAVCIMCLGETSTDASWQFCH